MADGYISQIKTPDNKVYLLKDSAKTDEKVKQTSNTEDKEFPILFKNANNTTEETAGVKYSGNITADATTTKPFTFNPSTGNLTVTQLKIGTKNDNMGLFPNLNNWNQIGSGSLYWYRSYINNYYGGRSHVDNWDSGKNIGTAASASAAATKGTVNFYNSAAANATQTKTLLEANTNTNSNITITLPSSTGTLALTSQIPTNLNQLTNGPGYVTSSGITSVTIGATSPVQSSTSTAQNGSSASTTISLKDAYGDTKNPYGAKAKNLVLAGPASGSNAAPSFRALVAADIPSLAYVPATSGANDVNTLVNTGIYNITSGSLTNGPVGYGYGQLLVMSYRKHTGNTTTDWATQLYTHLGNGNNGNTLYFRTSNASTWQTWQMVAHADAGSAKGNSTKPIYINAKGEIQEGTALEDLAYIAKPTSNATTTFLRGDGTWQTALTAHQSLAAYATLASPALTGTPTAPTATNGTSTTQIATTEFVNNTLSYVNAMRFKGTLGTGGTVTELPTSHEAGDTYRVITAGTWAGEYCETGTLIICTTDGTAANAAHWTAVETNEDGAVIGPSSSTDNAIARFDGATGRIIQNSGITINDNGNLIIAHAASATMTTASTNPQIIFSDSGSQPVHLIYSDYDNYRAPAGLKIIGGTNASPAWLEVEGDTWSSGFKITGKTTSLTDNNLTFSQGGGWSMSDSTWIRTVGSKSVYMNTGTFRNDGTTQLRSLVHINASTVDDGSWITGATGTAPTATTTDGTTTYSGATIGTSILTLGNNKVGANSASGVANNSRGYLRIYGAGNGYGELSYNDSMFASNKSIYLTNTANSGINNEIRGLMAGNDYWRVAGGATASNAGYMEIATADDGSEPIYVRQYSGVFATLKHTATLLDASGNTEFPVQVTAPKFIGALEGNATTATTATYIKCADTRNATLNPTDLAAAQGVRFDFKAKGTINLTATDSYAGVMSFRPYASNTDWSGGNAHQLAFNSEGLHWRNGGASWGNWYQILDSSNTSAASSSDISVGWNTSTTIATINGTAVKIKIPAKPTYTYSDVGAAPSSTVSCTTANVQSALGINTSSGSTSKALTEKGTWATFGTSNLTIGTTSTTAMAGNTTVTNVAISANVTTNADYPIVFATSNKDTTAAKNEGLQKSGAKFYFNPSTGNIQATTFNGYTLAAASAKGVVTTIDTSANLPTSNAVKTFIEGKGYVTSSGVTSIKLIQGAGITVSSSGTAITTTGERTISITGMDTTNGSTTKWLNQKGGWSTPTAANVGALASSTVVTNVAISADTTTNKEYALVFGTTPSDGTSPTAAKTEGLQKNITKFYTNPSTGTLYSTKFCVDEHVTLQWNSTDNSLDFVFA